MCNSLTITTKTKQQKKAENARAFYKAKFTIQVNMDEEERELVRQQKEHRNAQARKIYQNSAYIREKQKIRNREKYIKKKDRLKALSEETDKEQRENNIKQQQKITKKVIKINRSHSHNNAV